MFSLFVDSQQTGQFVINGGNDGNAYTLPSAVTRPDKALLDVSFHTDADQESPVVFLSADGTQIVAQGSGFGNDVVINFNLIQFRHDSDITIDHFRQLVNALGESVITSNQTFSGQSAFVRWNGHASSADELAGVARLRNPFSSRSFIQDMDQANAGSARTLAYQLVHFLDATSVTTFTTSGLTTNQQQKDVTVSTQDPDATLVIIQTDQAQTSSAISTRQLNAWMEDAATVRIWRSGIGADLSGEVYEGTLVSFDQASVRTGPISYTGANGTASLNTAITRQGASIIAPYQRGFAEAMWPSNTTLSNALAWQHGYNRIGFGSTQTAVDFIRSSAFASTVSGVVQVVQWNTTGAQFADSSPWTDEISSGAQGGPQLLDLCTIASLVTKRLGDRHDIAYSDVTLAINMAQQEIAQMAPQNALEVFRFASGLSSNSSVSRRMLMPDNYDEPFVLSLVSWDPNNVFIRGSGQTLDRISEREMDTLDSTITGQPQKYALYGRWLEFWPSIDSAYSFQLRYKKFPSVWTGECGTYPEISPQWRQALLFKSEQLLAECIGDDEHAARMANRFTGFVNKQDSDLAKKQKDKSARPGVRVTGWSRPRRLYGNSNDFDRS